MSPPARELIVLADDPAELTAQLDGAATQRLFDDPALPPYLRVFDDDARLDALADRLRALPTVRAAYVKPAATVAGWGGAGDGSQPTETTPDFVSRQGYLGAAPEGVDAAAAWSLPGGDGAGVGVVDIEGAWRFTHEDLRENKGGVIGGEPARSRLWRDHGTAVIGVIGGDRNAFGVTGISPAAKVSAVSVFGGTGSAGAIVLAAQRSQPGDVILIELHRPGPRARGRGQEGYIAIEWWPDDWDAIRYATERGVIVVEAAGNGAECLDHGDYDRPARGFPDDWSNPFRRGARDSGAVIVGAGAPPPGTHGRDWGPDRSRLDFSNHGECVDAQGWGREVTTCGYGDLQGGDEDRAYTDTFSGTSSASPIVVGAIASAQGILKARQRPPLTPAEARALLREVGSAQTDAPGRPATERIGRRPDLRAMIERLAPARPRDPSDAGDAALRVAAGALLQLARGPLAATLSARIGADEVVMRGRIERALEGPLGELALRAMMSLGLSALAPRVPVAGALARELRVSAMSDVAARALLPLLERMDLTAILGATPRGR